MPDFQGDSLIYLQPAAVKETYRLRAKSETSAGAGDGALPYGFTPTSCAVVATTASGTDVSSTMLADASPTVQSSGGYYYVDVSLTYVVAADGELTTLETRWSDGTSTYPLDAERVYCGDRSA